MFDYFRSYFLGELVVIGLVGRPVNQGWLSLTLN